MGFKKYNCINLNNITVKAILILMTCFITMVKAQTPSGTYNLLVGTYSSEKSKGIHVYSFNTETGEFTAKSEADVKNPSYLAITNDRKHV